MNTHPITHEYIETNGIRLHVAACGPPEGELVILLHGFPEYWGAWRPHMQRLAHEGYRVLAPDQRGYNLSDKPSHPREYTTDKLAADIAGLIQANGRAHAHIAGHDWGAAVAWEIARALPERISRLVIINCPPTDVMQRFAVTHPRQLFKSWYILFFQIPLISEMTLKSFNFKCMRVQLLRSCTGGVFDGDKLDGHLKAWGQPHALTGALNWYRAAVRYGFRKKLAHVTCPTLILWGEKDHFLDARLASASLEICEQGRLIQYPDYTHWIAHEASDVVMDEMIQFLDQATQ